MATKQQNELGRKKEKIEVRKKMHGKYEYIKERVWQ